MRDYIVYMRERSDYMIELLKTIRLRLLGFHYTVLLGLMGYRLLRFDSSFVLGQSVRTGECRMWYTEAGVFLYRYGSYKCESDAMFSWSILMGRSNL